MALRGKQAASKKDKQKAGKDFKKMEEGWRTGEEGLKDQLKRLKRAMSADRKENSNEKI